MLVRSPLRPLALAVSLALTAAHGVLLSPQAQAAQQDVRTYAIAAGPLANQLNQFAAQAGIFLAADGALTANKTSPALNGNYSVEQALRILLQGSGLEALSSGDNRYQLQPAASNGALELSAMSISGKAPGSTTEGTGSYTTWSSSSSTRLNLSPKETPQSVTVLTQQRLTDQHLTTVTDTLEAAAGITVVRENLGADADSYWSRGFQINNFEVDGVPSSARLDNYAQSTAMYDRVEIVRGATGLISGMGNPSATINLIRKRPTADFHYSLTGEAGSWDRYGSGVDVSGSLTDSGNVRGRLVVDYKDQHAWFDRYSQESTLVYGISEFDLSEATLLTAGFSWQKIDSNSPPRSGVPLLYSNGNKTDFSRSFNPAPDWSYYNRDQLSVFTSLEHQFDNGWSTKVEYNHSRNDYDGVVDYLASDSGVDQATGSGAYVMPVKWGGTPEQDSIDGYFTGPFALFGREHELITGLTLSRFDEPSPDYGGWLRPGSGYDGSIADLNQWNGESPRPQFGRYGSNDVEETQYGAYLTSRFHVTDDLSVIVGGRVVDWHRTSTAKPDGAAKSKTEQTESGVTIPYGGVVYDLDPTWAVYASYTKIFNPQGSWVRDSNNGMLDPEEGTSYEAGIKAAFADGRLNASLALFKAEQDNLAIWDGDTNAYYSEEGVTSHGAELEVNGELADGWQVAGGYTYSISEDADDQRIVTQLPRHTVKTFTTYRLHGALEKLTIGGGLNWQSKTGYDLHTYTQDSYFLASLMARYQISENLSASVNVNNLFDEAYYSSASTYGTYGAPRNVMTSLKYSY